MTTAPAVRGPCARGYKIACACGFRLRPAPLRHRLRTTVLQLRPRGRFGAHECCSERRDGGPDWTHCRQLPAPTAKRTPVVSVFCLGWDACTSVQNYYCPIPVEVPHRNGQVAYLEKHANEEIRSCGRLVYARICLPAALDFESAALLAARPGFHVTYCGVEGQAIGREAHERPEFGHRGYYVQYLTLTRASRTAQLLLRAQVMGYDTPYCG
jgi:hypothetical protein